jgi:hypothetical protein
MNILLAIWLFLLDLNIASGGDFSKDQLEPFFRSLYDSFLHQSLNAPMSEGNFRQFIFFIENFPLKTLEIVNDIKNR